jgi:hypothetical protein
LLLKGTKECSLSQVRNHKTIKYRIGIARETGSVACYGDAE